MSSSSKENAKEELEQPLFNRISGRRQIVEVAANVNKLQRALLVSRQVFFGQRTLEILFEICCLPWLSMKLRKTSSICDTRTTLKSFNINKMNI